MVLSVTYNNTLYLFDVVSVRDDRKRRKLCLIRWGGGGCLLAEKVPVFNLWIREAGLLFEEEFQAAVFEAVDMLPSRKVLEEVTLSQAAQMMAECVSNEDLSFPSQLPRSA